MEQVVINSISTESGENEFQVRLLKHEGVGLLTTKNGDNYLILDSLDYWYDVIQNEYPKKKKCSCKNEWFLVAFEYIPRSGTDDIRAVGITTICTLCKKVSKPVSIDIDYSPTNHLMENPITLCEKPQIRYDFFESTSYWSGDDLREFLQFIFVDLGLNVYCWFLQYPENKRKFERISFEKAMQIITVNHRYLNFYFSGDELEMESHIKLTDANGVYLDEDIWRRGEIIQLSAPFPIFGYGLMYKINFGNQYLDKGVVKNKSERFEIVTTKLKKWLAENFVTKRGRNCFDGAEAFAKIIAKMNSRK